MTPSKETITGLILAGGRGSRFNNEDKGLIPYRNTTLAEHAIKRLKPQTSSIMVSANRHLDFYNKLDAKIVEDEVSNYSGPLAGIHAALKNLSTDWLVCIACDTPCFPEDYAEQLASAIKNQNTLLAVAKSNGHIQSVSVMLHKSLFDSLNQFLIAGERKAKIWLEQHNPAFVNFDKPNYAFYNINTPDDLIELERLESND